jgi:histidine triad (HIT) family protein
MTTRHTREANPTIFGKIIRGEIPAKVVHEDDHTLAFHDIHPQAPVHVVIIPKDHLANVGEATATDTQLLGHLMVAAAEVARKLNVVESGFRLITNSGPDSGQEVPHLHLHLLAGKKLGAKIVA